MALVKTDDMAAQFRGLGRLSVMRQFAMMAGLAASVALGMWVAVWSQTPVYQVLFSNLTDTDAAQIGDELQKEGVQYKIDERTGTVMVPGDSVHEVRMKLASQGLPKGSGIGFEILEKESGFGTSQFIETARYQRALEGELARTIASLDNVKTARVHLAIPAQPSFIRNRKKPSASIMVALYAGRNLDDGQVAAITHLVSSSVPSLDPDRVTVIDDKGQLLTSPNSSGDMALSSSQFEYRHKMEQDYEHRIEDLLTPVMGPGKVRAQVSADLDFTAIDQTKETYNPDLPAIRSEQTTEQKTVGAAEPQGVPGALSNQPPVTGQGAASAQGETQAAAQSQPPVNTTSRSIRNYELDRVISHTRMPSGSVRRLSVAVVLDNLSSVDSNGEAQSRALTQQELDRFTGLVKDAIGFNAERGDSVSVINVPFSVPPAPEPLPEPSFFEKPWVWSTLKTGGAVIMILFIAFGVLRPVLRELAAKGKVVAEPYAYEAAAGAGVGQLAGQPPGRLAAPTQDYNANLNKAKVLASQDPKVVAQVVKNWVGNDA
jgi:flagellar M-ring protein FliF